MDSSTLCRTTNRHDKVPYLGTGRYVTLSMMNTLAIHCNESKALNKSAQLEYSLCYCWFQITWPI